MPAAGQGIDAGTEIAGRRRHLGVDGLGLLLAIWVAAASVSDNVGGMHLLSRIAAARPHLTKAWADTGYPTKAIAAEPASASTSKSSNASPAPQASK